MSINTCPLCGTITENNNSADTHYVCFGKCITKDSLSSNAIYGWLCPRCQKVHSPSIANCDCKPQTITSSGTVNLSNFTTKDGKLVYNQPFVPEQPTTLTYSTTNGMSDLSAIQAIQLLREQAENRENDTKTTL